MKSFFICARVIAPLLAMGSLAHQAFGAAEVVKPTAAAPFATDPYWPLTKGTCWIYEAQVEWRDGAGDHQRKLRWRSEVVETASHGVVAAAQVKGDPADLVWFEEGREPLVHVVVRVGSARYYRLSGESGTKAMALVAAKAMENGGGVNGGN